MFNLSVNYYTSSTLGYLLNMKRVLKLSENDLTNLIKKIIIESENELYYIVAYPYHLGGNGMFVYTGDGGYSMIPTSIEFRRRMNDEMDVPPMSYGSRREALQDLKMIKKSTKHRPELRWEIVKF